MDLIDRDELRMIIFTTGRSNGKTAFAEAISMIINGAQTVDAIPIEFIKKKIDKIREIEDQAKDEPLSAYFELVRTSERCSLEWLLLDWKAEQEKRNE